MYESIKGTLKDKDPVKVIVEAGGIGYRLSIPLSTYTRLPVHESPIQLYLSQVVREDAHILYAFLLKEERDLFEILITISGVGPKTAIAIIGHMEFNAFQYAITSADTRILSKIPGIGKKTAERLVIEMRDKFKPFGKKDKTTSLAFQSSNSLIGDAVNALLHLGYNPIEAQKAVQTVMQEKEEESDLGRLITAALQRI